ncbi:unnamed protein product [Rotaria magnacalcarata]|uniref:Uncharacterized protein n=2 Tax=Rotaria magnacalcarata TaxID=392030 RepID=A0A819CUK1_9BILA|nr:unnamed protein product [Rotaria magnacalcarata]
MRFYVQSLANHSVLIGSFLRPAKTIFSNVNHLILISQIDLTLNNENKRFPVLSENEYRTLKHKLRVSALHPKIQAVGTTYGGEVLGYECPLFLKADETGKRIFGKASYAYFNVSTYTSNLISLDLLIYVSPNTVSVCSILPILRVCRRIRYLHAIIKHEIPSENNNLNVSIRELFINENDLPISPKLTSFDISIFTTCDTRSIAYILRCMPNLLHFKFLHESREKTTNITPRTACSFPLFQHINSLVIDMRTLCSSSWSNSLRFVNCVQPNGNDDAQQYVAYLSNVVHFP